MMLSRVESGEDNGSDSTNGRLLRDIEEISRALYPHKTPANNVISPSDRRSKSAGKTRLAESNSKFLNENLSHKDKKSSIWNWKPFKALTHMRNRQFNCWFFLHVHAIEGLPSNFNDTSLRVEWKRKDEVLRSRSSRVCQGMAEFEETLMHQCSVYGGRNGHHQSAKYEPKLFLLYASVIGAPGLDLGKHWIDLTRLLPVSLEELEEEKSSGKWTTSFKLTGKAKGAMLNVSFGFSVMRDKLSESGSRMHTPRVLKDSKLIVKDSVVDIGHDSGGGLLHRVGSVPCNSNCGSHMPSRSLNINILNEVFPNRGSELAQSVTYLCQKLDEAKLESSQEFDFCSEQTETLKPKPDYFSKSALANVGTESLITEFTVIERGVELSSKEHLKLECAAETAVDCAIETIDVSEIFNDDETAVHGEMQCDSLDEVYGDFTDQLVMEDRKYEAKGVCTEELMIEELDSMIYILSVSESGDFDPLLGLNEVFKQENCTKNRSSYKPGKMVRSRSLDDLTESIANEFLNMLATEQIPLDFTSDTEPQSPRELLLRRFEEEAIASGDFILKFGGEEERVESSAAAGPTIEWEDPSNDLDLPLDVRAAAEDEDQKRMGLSLISKRNAKLFENLETEALMKEWGLNESVFQNSPRTSSGGFGSPIYLPPEEPLEFPPLGDGLGSILQTNDGGFLRSMNPSLFKNAKNGGRLIMQVSTPVVLPVAMGSSIMEILQHWTSVGCEKMYLQVNRLMPLEDMNGKVMQQVVWEAASRLEAPESGRLPKLHRESEDGQDLTDMRKKIKEPALDWGLHGIVSSSIFDEIDSDYVSLEDLAPLAMEKIEALSVEGLRIQSGMSDEEAPSCIRPQSIGKTSAFLGSSVKIGGPFILEGAAGLQLPEVKESGDDVDELISLSITLDEWMRLDAGVFGDEEIGERTSKILAAHLAENKEFVSELLIRGGKWEKPTDRSCGLLGNNFTVALRVQLRDPLRDYEIVGAPMLALVEVERVFIDLKPRVYHRVSVNKEDDNLFAQVVEGINAEENQEKRIEEGIPLFKITEVHVAGFNIEPSKKQQWCTTTQEQSGARWLLASGMGKTIKYLSLKSNAIVKSSSQGMRKMQPRDTLWSISSHVHGPRSKWKELATLNLHIRNPDVIFVS